MNVNVSKPRTYVFSAYRSDQNPHRNAMDFADASCDLALTDHPWTIGEGSYNGEREECFIVTGLLAGKAVRALSQLYKQESYLVIAEHTREAYLVDCETYYHKHIGRLVHVGSEEPECDSWTQCGGEYYTTEIVGKLTDLPEGF